MFKNYTKIIAILLLVAISVAFTSCKDDDEVSSGQVELLSFGPSGVKHGDQIKIIGKNLDKVQGVVLAGVESPITSFSTHTKELIVLTIPEEAEGGKLILKTSNGDIESKTILSFEVPVTITSITEEAKPGTNITIKGTKVNWIESVTFASDVMVKREDFVSRTQTEIVVTVPMEAQTGRLVLSTGGTEPLTIDTEKELIVITPVVESISPLVAQHLSTITIFGSDLDLVTSIEFGGDKMVTTFESHTDNEIVVTVPVGSLKGKLTLQQASPVSVETDEELTVLLPVGVTITPKPAIPGEDNVTISGSNLLLVEELELVGVEEPISDFINHTDTEITLALPESAENGSILYTTIHGYSAALGISLLIPTEGPLPLTITLYDETIAGSGGDWSWDGDSDPANGEQFYSGEVSWKFETSAGGGISAGGISAVDASSMTYLSFSLYGGPGTDGADVAVILNDDWGSYNSVKLVEGEWTEYQLELTNFSTVDLSAIVRFAFKVEGITESVIYADRIGLE